MLRSVPFTLPSNLSLDFMKANTKRINNEFRTWRDKLAKRGCTCRVRGLDLADNYLSVDVVPDISVHDDNAFVSQLTSEIQSLVPETQIVVVVDHNYSE